MSASLGLDESIEPILSTSTSKPCRADPLMPSGVPTAFIEAATSEGLASAPACFSVSQKSLFEALVGAALALVSELLPPPQAPRLAVTTTRSPVTARVLATFMCLLASGAGPPSDLVSAHSAGWRRRKERRGPGPPGRRR